MKRQIIFLIAASLFLASCGGRASLWGQYATPTPVGGIPPTPSPLPPATSTQPPITASPAVLEETLAPTPTFDEAFITREPTATVETTAVSSENRATLLYYAQSGDWLPAVAIRFGVDVKDITSPKILPEQGLLDPGTLLMIPDVRDPSLAYTPAVQLIPDNELI